MTRGTRKYQEIFFAAHGEGPFPCAFCPELVEYDVVQIHHVDEDRTNNNIENLASAHGGCHTRHHLKGKPKTAEHAKNISLGKLAAGLAGYVVSEETREKISNTLKERGHRPTDEAIAKAAELWKGGQHSDETKAKMSEYAKKRTPEHQAKLNAAQTGSKKSPEARENMRQAALRRRARERAEREAQLGGGA